MRYYDKSDYEPMTNATKALGMALSNNYGRYLLLNLRDNVHSFRSYTNEYEQLDNGRYTKKRMNAYGRMACSQSANYAFRDVLVALVMEIGNEFSIPLRRRYVSSAISDELDAIDECSWLANFRLHDTVDLGRYYD